MIKTFLIEKKYDDDDGISVQYICCDHTEIRKVIEFIAGVHNNMTFTVTELTKNLSPSKRKDTIRFKLNANDYSPETHMADIITSLFNNKISGKSGIFKLPINGQINDIALLTDEEFDDTTKK